MKSLKDEIIRVKTSCTAALAHSTSLDQLEATRVTFLGRKGELAELMVHLKTLSLEEKREYGPVLNELKQETELLFEQRKRTLLDHTFTQAEQQYKNFDVTAYCPQQPRGSLHLYTLATQEIQDLFISMGYQVMDGPEVETDFYNFEALNIPADHPARDMQDTFWVNVPGLVLRTHTSNVQIRTMENQKPPFAIIATGRVYRHEATDASHDYMFRQLEGLFIGENISIANLIATMKLFLQKFFKKDTLTIRCRPSYFPFVEPGIEIDMSCPFCTTGCSTCKQSTWIEVVGAGLVHPNVLQHGGVDAKKYSGFAFGFGLTRLIMMKYGINDIRLLHTAHIDFLKQF